MTDATDETRSRMFGMTDEQLARKCRESRAAQGLPPTIQDGPTLDKIATILRSIRDRGAS